MEMGPHKDREKLWPGWEFRSPLHRLSYMVRREQAVGTEDVKVTAMNMYKYKEGLRFYWNVGRVALTFQKT